MSKAGEESILPGEQLLCMWQEWCLQGRVLSPWEEPSVSQVWDQVTSAVRPTGPIIDLGLFYRNPKSSWKSKGRNPHFSLQHLPYFSSEKAHYVQQRKPQPFPEKWIMRDSNWERERERKKKTERERETPVTDDAALNHVTNLLGGWERQFTSLDVCFDNYKLKA